MKPLRAVIVAGAVAVLNVCAATSAIANCGAAAGTILKPIALQLQADSDRGDRLGERQGDASSGPHASIVGLWKVTLTSGGTVIDVGFDAWHSDGTEILNDASPVSHNMCLGVWVQTGPRRFQLKHLGLRFDAGGNLIGTLILRETNVVTRAGDRFTGTFTIEFFDLAGNSVFQGSGEIAGERITVD